MRYAGFWARLWAGIIDGLIIMLIFSPIYFYQFWSWHSTLVIQIIGAIFGALFSILFIGIKGQTPGKMVMGIKVTPLDGSPITLKHGFYRHSVDLGLSFISSGLTVTALLSIEPAVFNGIDNYGDQFQLMEKQIPNAYLLFSYLSWGWIISELVVLLFNEKKRAIHDFIAGTVVIHIPKPDIPDKSAVSV